MRISDWCSDVCSSDLDSLPLGARPVALVEHIGEGNLLPRARHVERDVIVAREEHQLVAKIIGEQVGTRSRGFEDARAFEAADGELMPPLDRKSGGEGKRVSVRVYPGGSRIIKKK